ncbi:hypothetical protein BJ878DRAFT_577269 [Calycina marina]|uniref:Uncharacterized protein n=1 Tax=Calycina marina TaxID=1763456 RepID=A0A9P7Z061_9HELO|nr:hypothetical protein BJ878DRAFT_577269 [Calycina marina]
MPPAGEIKVARTSVSGDTINPPWSMGMASTSMRPFLSAIIFLVELWIIARPSFTVMGLVRCCISRAPSSPDGLHPRPVEIRSPPVHRSSRRVSLPSSNLTTSPLSNPKDAADLHAIFEDDNSSITGDEVRSRPRKGSSKAYTVAERLKRRLSRDFGNTESSKRHSRSSVGSSEEEVERRAELRRIRQRRIEHELSNEIYDDDARSLSTIPGGITPVDQNSRASRHVEYLPTPSLTPPDLTFPSLPYSYFSACRPLSTSAVQERGRNTGILPSENTRNMRSYSHDINTSYPRRHLVHHRSFPEMRTRRSTICGSSRSLEILMVPKSPFIQPMRLPSITDPDLNSAWRLSFSGPSQGENLNQLSRGFVISPPLSTKSAIIVGHKPLNRWLHSQGLGSMSQALSDTEGPDFREILSPTYFRNEDFGNEDFGGVDGTVHGTSISRYLESTISPPPILNSGDQMQHRLLTSSDTPGSWSNVLPGEEDRLPGSLIYSGSASLVAPNTSNLIPRFAGRPSRPTAGSSAVSETDSHHQLEAELKYVEARFSVPRQRAGIGAHISSRFHEEFDTEAATSSLLSPDDSEHRGQSIGDGDRVSSFDGAADELLAVPPASMGRTRSGTTKSNISMVDPADTSVLGIWDIAIHGRERNTSSVSRAGLADDSVLDIWGKAINDVKTQEQDEKGKSKSRSGVLGRISSWRSLGSQPRSSFMDCDARKESFDTLRVKKDDVVDDWERELEETAKRAKARSMESKDRAYLGPDRRYPETWARYSSHNRAEISQLINPDVTSDGVVRRDFAIRSTVNGKPIWYRNERSRHPGHHDNDGCPADKPKNIISRIGSSLLARTLQLPSSLKDGDLPLDQTYGRRGSVTPAAPLEFPELEILAVKEIELMSVNQIVEHVEDMAVQEEVTKREEEKRQRDEEQKLKEQELDAMFSGPRERKKESAIAKARRAAEEEKARISEGQQMKRKKRLDQFGVDLDEFSDEEIVHEASKREKNRRKATEGLSKPNRVKVDAETAEEGGDTAGMDRSVLKEQVAARAALKKRMENLRSVEGSIRRGPVARVIAKANEPVTPTLPASPVLVQNPIEEDDHGVEIVNTEARTVAVAPVSLTLADPTTTTAGNAIVADKINAVSANADELTDNESQTCVIPTVVEPLPSQVETGTSSPRGGGDGLSEIGAPFNSEAIASSPGFGTIKQSYEEWMRGGISSSRAAANRSKPVQKHGNSVHFDGHHSPYRTWNADGRYRCGEVRLVRSVGDFNVGREVFETSIVISSE